MENLYEILDKIVDEYMEKKEMFQAGDIKKEELTKKDVTYRSNKLTENLKKKIGDEEYMRLEDYIRENKDNEYMKELIGSTSIAVIFNSVSDIANILDKSVIDVKLNYRLMLSVHEKLSRNNYDAELAMLE